MRATAPGPSLRFAQGRLCPDELRNFLRTTGFCVFLSISLRSGQAFDRFCILQKECHAEPARAGEASGGGVRKYHPPGPSVVPMNRDSLRTTDLQ